MPIFTEAKTPQEAKKILDEQTIVAAKFRIKWKDIFDAKQFYIALHEWLDEYGWKDPQHGSSPDYHESLYFERLSDQGDKELWIRWRMQKFPDEVENSYYKYHMDFDYHFLYLIPTEVMHEGKKFKKNVYKGEVEVWIHAYLQFDYQGAWSKHPVLQYFNKMFPKRIFRKDLYDEKKKELYREAYILQNYIKHWFKLHRFLPHEEMRPFHRSYAFPTYQRQS